MGPTTLANERALALFESLLTPEERAEWKRDLRVTLTGSEGGVYQLSTGGSMSDNVYQIDPTTKERMAVLCAAPNMWPTGNRIHMPVGDAFVGQLLGLRYNERLFVHTACISYYRGYHSRGSIY